MIVKDVADTLSVPPGQQRFQYNVHFTHFKQRSRASVHMHNVYDTGIALWVDCATTEAVVMLKEQARSKDVDANRTIGGRGWSREIKASQRVCSRRD